jgi:hypothetical protein
MRIPGVDPTKAEGELAKIFEAQVREWGSPLLTTRTMARCPSILRGYRSLIEGIKTSGLLADDLKALINRRVASHNGCPF